MSIGKKSFINGVRTFKVGGTLLILFSLVLVFDVYAGLDLEFNPQVVLTYNDTLQSVTDRGSKTTNIVYLNRSGDGSVLEMGVQAQLVKSNFNLKNVNGLQAFWDTNLGAGDAIQDDTKGALRFYQVADTTGARFGVQLADDGSTTWGTSYEQGLGILHNSEGKLVATINYGDAQTDGTNATLQIKGDVNVNGLEEPTEGDCTLLDEAGCLTYPGECTASYVYQNSCDDYDLFEGDCIATGTCTAAYYDACDTWDYDTEANCEANLDCGGNNYCQMDGDGNDCYGSLTCFANDCYGDGYNPAFDSCSGVYATTAIIGSDINVSGNTITEGLCVNSEIPCDTTGNYKTQVNGWAFFNGRNCFGTNDTSACSDTNWQNQFIGSSTGNGNTYGYVSTFESTNAGRTQMFVKGSGNAVGLGFGYYDGKAFFQPYSSKAVEAIVFWDGAGQDDVTLVYENANVTRVYATDVITTTINSTRGNFTANITVQNITAKSGYFTNNITTGNITYYGLLNSTGNISVQNITANNLNVSRIVVTNLYITGNFSAKRPYGMFSSTQDQTLPAADTAVNVSFNWTEDSYLVNKQGDVNFSVNMSGDYLIELSAIFQSAIANKVSHIWVQIWNGTAWNNVPRSNTQMTIRTSGSDYIVAVPFILDIHTNEKFRIMFAGNDAGIFINYNAGTAYAPETPSIIMTVSKISEHT